MGRRSQCEHLKQEILAEFAKGKPVGDVKELFPAVSLRTLYDWHKKWLDAVDVKFCRKRNALLQKEGDNRPIETTVLTIVPFDPDVKRQESDIKLARKTLRSVAENPTVNPAIRVQASLGLMKLAYLRAELPRHVIEEIEEIDNLAQERQDLASVEPSELVMQYREMIANE